MNDSRQPEKPTGAPIAPTDMGHLTETVRRCWEEVLRAIPTGIGADFLGCGGDSLRAVALCRRLASALGFTVSPGWLLSTPHLDIETLSSVLAEGPVADAPSPGRGPTSPAATAVLPSFSQERMWFMHQLAPSGLAYNVSQAVRLTGAVNPEALQEAVEAVVSRHALLRGRFTQTPDGLRWDALQDSAEPALERIEVDAKPGDGRMTDRLQKAVAHLVRTPFDLTHGPVFRAALVRADDQDSVLLLWAHHIVADQWAFDILMREIAEAYNAGCDGRPARPASDAPDFGSYVAWHRDWFQRERAQPEVAYWLPRLRGLTPLILPTDRPRPPEQSFRGRRLHRPLEPALRDRLQQVAAQHGATLAMLLLAALKLLLRAHTDRTDIAVGVPVANRQHAGAAEVVGTLVNTLVLRSDLAACKDTLDVLALVRRNLLDALEHQDLPFEQLVQALEVPRDTATSPLFTVMFNMLNTPLGQVRFQGLEWSRFEFDRQAAQFDLTVTVDAEFDCSIVFEYASDLFEPATIARLADRYFHLLGRLAEAPGQPLTAELWLPAGELAQLDAWGTGPGRVIDPPTLSALVDTALKRPGGMILRWDGQDLTAVDIEQQSAALAGALQALGIGRGQLVGISLPRCPAMLVALVGVIRAGAAYVPLDPCYPSERLRFMAEDAGLAALVTDDETSRRYPWPDVPRLLLQSNGEPVDTAKRTALQDNREVEELPPPGGDDPAYVIYTSGSTGQPKGVQVRQASVVNFLLAMAERPGLKGEDRLLAVTTPSFDIAVLELLLPLWTGATLVLASQQDVVDGARIAHLIRDERISFMQATPATWRMLLEAGWQGQPGLKALVGGERLPPSLAYQLAGRAGEVWNMYGPTETTVWSSCWQLPARHEGSISLGSPIANTRLRVVDSQQQPCPIGAPGELLIGGAGVATGYLHNPTLTRARFLELPGEASPVYRTGDRVRWDADGTMEYLGRRDSQVKLRGHRIELGEIEDRLGRHPAVAGTVAAVVEETPGDARLLAYVVPWQQLPPPEELRDYLREWLPEHMLPQHFIELDAIPVLPNGKIARASLPAATAERIASARDEEHQLPLTPLEHVLLGLWSELLGLDTCSVTASFFELGGHSLLAVRLVSRIRERLGYDCQVGTLFRHPDVRSLATALERSADGITDTLVALQPLGDRDPVFCLCGVSLYARLAEALPTDRPVYGVFADSELGFLGAGIGGGPSVEELAARYLELIRARQPQGPVHLVGFSLGSAIALELAHRLITEGQPVGAIILLDGDVPGHARRRISFRLRLMWKAVARRLKSRPAEGASGQAAPVKPQPGQLQDVPPSRLPPAAAPERPFTDCIEAYRPRHYPGRAVFIEATESGREASFGWSALVGDLAIHRLPSDHLGLLMGAATERLAVIVTSELERFDAEHTP